MTAHPKRIGPYQILQVLGQGGMGVVYVAEQFEPVRRRVALKVIKLGMDTREVVARFEQERQALAVMEHPSIARVLDGGATEDGRPYFVMELVKGLPITEYCDTFKLTTRQRLELFIDVCHAVQHAHQKGVIHRDLKPSNILVMEQDGTPLPKVIDFGISKALATPLTDRSMVTEIGMAVGTAAYMSPEQASASALDVDTRTDIYSLGVTLYELLVGRLPVDPSEIGVNVFMARLSRHATNPSSPSAKLQTLGHAAAAISEQRRTDVRGLRRALRGDLDWIVMKALDADRGRRYDTANGLALDLQRFLNNEPVSARPPSARYRMVRFVQRNRLSVIAGGAVAASLVAGFALSALSLVRARKAEALARQEAETARQTADFLTGLFEVSDPGQARGNTITAREILDRGAARIRIELANDPVVQARLMATIGSVYAELGLYDDAQPLLEDALATRRAQLGAASGETRQSMLLAARVAQAQGRYEVAESLYLETLAETERAEGRDGVGLPRVLNGLGGLYVLRGRTDEARPLLERALDLRVSKGDTVDVEYVRLLRTLGGAYLMDKRYAEAEPLYLRAVAFYTRTTGIDHPEAGRTYSNLGVAYYGLQRYDDAERAYVRAESTLVKVLGADHPNLASININLGEIAWKRGALAEAERRLRRALAILAGVVQPNHPSIGTAEWDLANVLRDAGRRDEAVLHYRRALAVREAAFGPDSPQVAEVRADYETLSGRQ